MIIIPNQESKQHLQTNTDEYSGTLYKTKNISLDKRGEIKLAETSYAFMTEDDDGDFGACDAMFASTSNVYFNSDNIFRGTVGYSTLTDAGTDTNVPTPGTEDDVVTFNATEVVSDGNSISYRSAATTWTAIGSTSLPATAGAQTAMCVWSAQSNLVIGRDDEVIFVNTSWAVNGTRLQLPPDLEVTSLAANGSTLYIATKSKSGAEAQLLTVNSISASADYTYGCGTHELMSIAAWGDSVVGINALGQLLRFNGGGFDSLATLPIYAEEIEWADATANNTVVSHRSLVVDGDLIYINLNDSTEAGKLRRLPNFPGGVWCFDATNGSLYHRYSPSYTKIQNVAGGDVTVSAANNNFTLTSGNLNNVTTGMPVLYTIGSTAIPELVESKAYYIIKTSSTVFELAASYSDAQDGTAIDITGAGDTGQNFYIFLTNDYGWAGVVDNFQALAVLNNNHFEDSVAGRIAFTADLFGKQSSTSKSAANGVSPYLPNRGYVVTPKLTSINVEDNYVKVFVKYRPLDTDDKIIVKYKTQDKMGYPFSSIQYSDTADWIGTWSDTDTFTTTADLSSVVAGDEIEIISGVGAGHIANVSSISESTGTYTVNIDEAFPFAATSDIMRFDVDNFTLAKTITSSNQTGTALCEVPIGKASKFLQLKIELRGIGVIVEEIQVVNKTHKPTS